MKVGTRVKLVTFNGSRKATIETPEHENYWKLVGTLGTIIEEQEERKHFPNNGKNARDCVQFDTNPNTLGLAAHNKNPRSLWMLRSDLEIIEA